MTRAHADNRSDDSAVNPGVNRPTRSASIRWRIGKIAGKRAFGVESGDISLEIAVSESDDGDWSGTVRVLGDSSRTLTERTVDVNWQADAELQLLHIDAAEFVCATIDTSNGLPRLLYAKSGLLGKLGLDGGRYEPEGTELQTGD